MSPLRSPWRWPAAGLLLLNAAVHLPLVPEHLEESAYVGVLFILLSTACLALAVTILVVDTAVVWATSGLVSALAIGAFLISRTLGLPQMADDIGNWTEPLGYPALAAEALSIVLAAWVLTHAPTGAHHPRTQPADARRPVASAETAGKAAGQEP